MGASDIAPGERLAGRATIVGGFPLEVYAYTDGTVTLWEPESAHALTFDSDGLAELRELLDRIAMPGRPAPAPDQRVAVDEHGNLKPVSEFSRAEQWWCDGEDCGGDRGYPHVHCFGHHHAVDLITGRSIDGHGHAAAAVPATAGEA